MNEICLTPKELLVLASSVGAGNFYGIKDPFCGMAQQEIEAAIPSIQLALEQKGYAQLGFDSAFHIVPDVLSLVSVCAMCEKYVMIDVISNGERVPKEVLYFSNKLCVKLTQDDEGVKISSICPEAFIDDLIANVFQRYPQVVSDKASVAISKNVLDQAKERGVEDAKQMLQSAGCSPAVASAIADGLNQRCTTVSLVAVDLKGHSLDAAIYIVSQTTLLSMKLDDFGDQDNWCVKQLAHGELKQELLPLIGSSAHRGGTDDALM